MKLFPTLLNTITACVFLAGCPEERKTDAEWARELDATLDDGVPTDASDCLRLSVRVEHFDLFAGGASPADDLETSEAIDVWAGFCEQLLLPYQVECALDAGRDPVNVRRCVLGSRMCTLLDLDGDGRENGEDVNVVVWDNYPDDRTGDADGTNEPRDHECEYVERPGDREPPSEPCSFPVEGAYETTLGSNEGEECSSWPTGFADGTYFRIYDTVGSGLDIEITANSENAGYTITRIGEAEVRCVAQLDGCALTAHCNQHEQSSRVGLALEWTFTEDGLTGTSRFTTLIDYTSVGLSFTGANSVGCTEHYAVTGTRI